MNEHRAVVGLCMLCALLASALAAQSASATTKGTTAYTCKETGAGGGFTKAHCKPSDAGSGNFSHVAIPQDTTTEVKFSTEKTNAETNACTTQVIKMTIGGAPIELSTCTIEGEGWMENKLDPSGEHYAIGHGSFTFTNVKVSSAGCKVYTDSAGEKGEEGVLHTNPVKLTTTEQGAWVKIEPTEGNVFATFILSGCSTGFLNNTYTVSGSLRCLPDGATITCNHGEVTSENTLKVNGSIKAGFGGKVTASSKAVADGAFNPLSSTIVETG